MASTLSVGAEHGRVALPLPALAGLIKLAKRPFPPPAHYRGLFPFMELVGKVLDDDPDLIEAVDRTLAPVLPSQAHLTSEDGGAG